MKAGIGFRPELNLSDVTLLLVLIPSLSIAKYTPEAHSPASAKLSLCRRLTKQHVSVSQSQPHSFPNASVDTIRLTELTASALPSSARVGHSPSLSGTVYDGEHI